MKQITVEDFDNAVKQPWDCDTCILSQAGVRLHSERSWLMRLILPIPKWHSLGRHYGSTVSVRRTFDQNFFEPGDETKPALQALRASLPTTLE